MSKTVRLLSANVENGLTNRQSANQRSVKASAAHSLSNVGGVRGRDMIYAASTREHKNRQVLQKDIFARCVSEYARPEYGLVYL